VGARVTIELDGRVIAETTDAVRVLETSHPPVYYLPRAAFADGVLQPAEGSSFCEFKGRAGYLSVGSADRAAWFYAHPSPGFEALIDRVRCAAGARATTRGGRSVRPAW
jgi:uncharacterized protein (DUF427 family)